VRPVLHLRKRRADGREALKDADEIIFVPDQYLAAFVTERTAGSSSPGRGIVHPRPHPPGACRGGPGPAPERS